MRQWGNVLRSRGQLRHVRPSRPTIEERVVDRNRLPHVGGVSIDELLVDVVLTLRPVPSTVLGISLSHYSVRCPNM